MGQSLLFSLVVWFLVKEFREPQTIVVIDDETIYLPKDLEFVEAKDLHISQAKLAVQALLNRDSAGIDNEDQLKRLYGVQAFEKARKLIEREALEFQVKNLHQKVGIEEVVLIQLQGEQVRVQVKGDLNRVGRVQDENIVEVLEFTMSLTFQRNRNMRVNGRYPSVVTEFVIKTKPVVAE